MERIQAIFQGDRLIQDFGMTLVEGRDGYAKVSVVVADRFLNAHRIGHGVLLFAVADAAFALAVNATRDAVGVQWSLNAFRAAQLGETVIGEAKVIHAGRQSLVCVPKSCVYRATQSERMAFSNHVGDELRR